jgi:hypothetical protein
MKVKQIRARRHAKAIPVVLKLFGPKCPTFDAECVTCQGHRLLNIHKRIPHVEETCIRVWAAGDVERQYRMMERARELEDFDMHTKEQ